MDEMGLVVPGTETALDTGKLRVWCARRFALLCLSMCQSLPLS